MRDDVLKSSSDACTPVRPRMDVRGYIRERVHVYDPPKHHPNRSGVVIYARRVIPVR